MPKKEEQQLHVKTNERHPCKSSHYKFTLLSSNHAYFSEDLILFNKAMSDFKNEKFTAARMFEVKSKSKYAS